MCTLLQVSSIKTNNVEDLIWGWCLKLHENCHTFPQDFDFIWQSQISFCPFVPAMGIGVMERRQVIGQRQASASDST
jgi:hypothetical protein